jgi:hypothetical protein
VGLRGGRYPHRDRFHSAREAAVEALMKSWMRFSGT